jgi:hypothetical protein
MTIMNFELGCLAAVVKNPGLLRALENRKLSVIVAANSLERGMANAKIVCHGPQRHPHFQAPETMT